MKDTPIILSQHVFKLWQNLPYYLETVNAYRYKYDITQREAWDKVEGELENAGLNARYTSYESFCSGQYNYHNRGK